MDAAWLIFMLLLTGAAPLAGLAAGLVLLWLLLRAGEALAEARSLAAARRAAGAGERQVRLLDMVLRPHVAFARPCENLPGELLHLRRRPFRIDCIETTTGRRRAYEVQAMHAGAATMKARAWGECLRSVQPAEIPVR